MHFLFDFFPILLFFATYKITGDLILATTVTIALTLLQLLVFRFKHGHYNKTHAISFATILVLGGATIFLQNELYIKWKPTAVYWVLASMLLASHFIGKKLLIERLIDNSLKLPAKIWKQLNLSWSFFFILMGSVNLYVVYNFSTSAWVNFKLFGSLALTLLFIIGQGVYISKFIPKESS